jgi:hypothetical protein
LASCLCRLLQRIVKNRFLWWLEHHQQIPGSQFGFRKGKPFTDNLSILHGEIINGFIKDKGTTEAFLDVTAAYDSELPDILDEKLKYVGVP